MHFSTMSEWLSPAKLDYACSVNYLDHIDALNLTGEQQAFLKDIPDPMFRDSVRDFMVNQQFRKDYWVKGARRLSVLEQVELLRQQKVVLATIRKNVSLKVSGSLGEAVLSEEAYKPILDVLADYKSKTVAQIEQAVKEKGITLAQIKDSIIVLTGAGHLFAVQEEHVIGKAKKFTDKLNAYLINKARGSGDINYLASPVTGGGVVVGRFQQLFVLALLNGRKKPEEFADFVLQILASQGQKIVKDSKTLETSEENLLELRSQATVFAEQQLPVLRALQVV